MSELILYLIKANIALCMFYLAYRLGLRRLTFYTLNRYFLLSGIVFSSLFPLVDVNDFVNRHETLAQQAVIYLPDFNAWQQAAQPEPFSIWTFMEWMFWAGVAVMAVRLGVQLVSLLFLHRKTSSANILDRRVRLMRASMNPFSFFRHIYVNPSLHGPDELKAILQHESIHVREWHSADVLMSELNQVFYWFNPGAWLMKTAVKENLEFLTDRTMLRTGVDRKAYQYSLVQVSAAQFAAGIANNFNFSHLKNRIKMMNKQRSSRFHITRYAILGCIVCGVLLSLNFTKAGTVVQEAVQEVKEAIIEKPVDTIAPPAKAPVVVEEKKPALKGKASGIVITTEKINEEISAAPQAESAPVATTFGGEPAKIRIGGMSGDTSKQPLILVDGKVMERNLNGVLLEDIDPNTIQSITVLKDQSATAIYGTKAANGVILISTKAKAKEKNPALQEVTVVGYGKKDKDDVDFGAVSEDGTRSLKGVVVVGYGSKEAATTVEGKPGSQVKVENISLDGKPAPDLSAKTVNGVKVENISLEDVMAKKAAATISEFKTYPNPTSGTVNVSFQLKDKVDKGYIEVTDASGKPVYRKSINGLTGNYNGQIDLGRFPAGVYYLVLAKDKARISSKIVKK
ncbi:T9SS type A sorting domain-containing protein [Chitinophaga cymbidii]|uniref:Peptidase M56 domain-containing protein n=1 Tax=Chitinophaga cymbidii TaxID=1096750 RepID=A0A512RL25_9BACT|nr:T9SS type A sorting domain-containing protein [Chitinophaga cymbidii]GEP96404.1 hypothetical protein CCY01nite_26640 [Chitinophaga cymbidii]